MGNYEKVTQQVLHNIKQGTLPWQSPYLASQGLPRNLSTGNKYRGINVWLLSDTDFDVPFWLTYKQAQAMGGNVRKGEKGNTIYKVGTFDVEDEVGETKKKQYLRQYAVFNARQTEGITVPEPPVHPGLEASIAKAEQIISNMPQRPEVEHSPLHRPSYLPLVDIVRMPVKTAFHGTGYHSTLFHELVHSTGHKSRLDRLGELTGYKEDQKEAYSYEELVAEMGAAYLSAECGLEREHDNSASYIKGWADVLSKKEHEQWILKSASDAQKAVDYILDEVAT